jgi:hypothetical protein
MPSSDFPRKQIRLLYMGLKSLRLDRETRALGEETHESLRKLLLDAEGGKEEVVDALFGEWDDRAREAARASQDERNKRESKRRVNLEQSVKKQYQQVYLWCNYEGSFSDGPYSSLTIIEGGQAIVDDKGERVAQWDPANLCWRTRKRPDWPIVDPPRISALRKSKWK